MSEIDKMMYEKDKRLLLTQWERFIKGGFQFKHFTDKLYWHLTLRFAFMAYYNKAGFYSTYFDTPEHTIEFIKEFNSDTNKRWLESIQYGDENKAMYNILQKYQDGILTKINEDIRNKDIETAKKLLIKHGIMLKI